MFWGLASGEVDPREFEFEHVLARHPDAEQLGARRDGSRSPRSRSPRTRSCRSATSCCRTARRWARATGRSSSRSRRWRLDDLRDDRDRGTGRADDRVPRPAALLGRLPLPRGAVRPDHRGGCCPGAPTRASLIHEGQLTYESEGLKKVVDLGEWWLLETGLPLPLGVERGAARPRRGRAVRAFRRARASRSRPGSTTARRRWSTRSSTAAASTRSSPTASSGCT